MTAPKTAQDVLRKSMRLVKRVGWVQGRYVERTEDPFHSACCIDAAIWLSLGVDPLLRREADAKVMDLGRETERFLAGWIIHEQALHNDLVDRVHAEEIIGYWNDKVVENRDELFRGVEAAIASQTEDEKGTADA